MVEFLAVQVRLGRIAIEQVPEKDRDEVQGILDNVSS